ncbi:MAG: NAD(P)/FAD-dependent oxidoreductase [Desulfosporosinus sp.]|nr:NAD(P)/FAD-dependent oxidoreductase [Desulfosporosinus sp.]
MRTAIIVGAGPAGLTAAYKFLKTTDIHPIIIEASGCVGGISQTVNYKGNRMDLGGHRFFSKDGTIVKMWTDLLPVCDPEKDDKAMMIRTRVSRILYLRKFFAYPISIKPETFFNMGLYRTLRVGISYISSILLKRNEKSLEDFMVNRFGTYLYKMFFENYTEKVWGKNPKEISASWGVQRVKGLSLSKALLHIIKPSKAIETSLIEQFLYPKLGPGQLWETMAAEIIKMGGEIRYNTEVMGVTQQDDQVSSLIIREAQGDRLMIGDIFISSMPIKDLILGMNDVPLTVRNIAAELPYRDFMTVGLLVKKTPSMLPDCWIYIQDDDVKIGRLQIFNNWSPYLVQDPVNTVWLGLEYFCSEGDDLWQMSDEVFIAFAIEELIKLNMIAKEDVLDSVRLKVKKAYPAYFGTYEQFDQVKYFLNGINNLYCIGRNGQHRYNNMDHSMLTAIKTVELIKNNGDKSTIWDVNTEDVYHEKC